MNDKSKLIPVWIGENSIEYLLGLEFKDGSIHLFCDAGKEADLFNSLPLFLSGYGNVVKGHRQVIINLNLQK